MNPHVYHSLIQNKEYDKLRQACDVIIQSDTITTLDAATAHYWLGASYKAQDNIEQATQHYCNSAIPESYWAVAEYHRRNNNNNVAYEYISKAVQAVELYPEPLIDKRVYQYHIDYELSIICYYVNEIEEGLRACDRILNNRDIPQNIYQKTLDNYGFYVNRISSIRSFVLPLEPIPIDGYSISWQHLNPSIVQLNNNRYIVMMRTVNYTQRDRLYTIYDKNQTIISRSILIAYDETFSKPLGTIQISNDYERIKNSKHIGIEDGRLFIKDKQLWFSATTADTSPYHIPQISLGLLGDVEMVWNECVNDETVILPCHMKPIRSPNNKRPEKNWIPIIYDDNIQFIYSHGPFTIIQPLLDNYIEDFSTDKANVVGQRLQYKQLTNTGYKIERFHGSTPPVPYKDGYLYMVHEINNKRHYFHRFVYCDVHYKLLAISTPFFFEIKGIEFAAGLSYINDDELIITYGLRDNTARALTINKHEIEKRLISLNTTKFINYFDTMPPIYCINLKRSPERKDRTIKRLTHHGVSDKLHFIEAVRHDSQLARYYDQCQTFDGNSLYKSQCTIACFASHLKAIRTFLEDVTNDDRGAIIMEDDILWRNNFVIQCNQCLENRPNEVETILFGWTIHLDIPKRWSGIRPYENNLMYVDPCHRYGAMTYWISSNGARRILAMLDRPMDPKQKMITSELIFKKSNCLLSYPLSTIEECLPSTIRDDSGVSFHIKVFSKQCYFDYSNSEEEDQSPLVDVEVAKLK